MPPRVPDLADAQVSVRAEANVVVEPLRRKVHAGFLELASACVVLLGSQVLRAEADDDAHGELLRARGPSDPTRVRTADRGRCSMRGTRVSTPACTRPASTSFTSWPRSRRRAT